MPGGTLPSLVPWPRDEMRYNSTRGDRVKPLDGIRGTGSGRSIRSDPARRAHRCAGRLPDHSSAGGGVPRICPSARNASMADVARSAKALLLGSSIVATNVGAWSIAHLCSTVALGVGHGALVRGLRFQVLRFR